MLFFFRLSPVTTERKCGARVVFSGFLGALGPLHGWHLLCYSLDLEVRHSPSALCWQWGRSKWRVPALGSQCSAFLAGWLPSGVRPRAPEPLPLTLWVPAPQASSVGTRPGHPLSSASCSALSILKFFMLFSLNCALQRSSWDNGRGTGTWGLGS